MLVLNMQRITELPSQHRHLEDRLEPAGFQKLPHRRNIENIEFLPGLKLHKTSLTDDPYPGQAAQHNNGENEYHLG